MKDSVIRYTRDGQSIERQYRTIMDFLDEMERSAPDKSTPDENGMTAVFFGNPFSTKRFGTAGELFGHCGQIIR